MTPSPTPEAVWQALNEVKDPEIPVVSVVEMGIVRDVELENQAASVTMTPTFSGCPALDVMKDDIRAKLLELGFETVEVKTVFSPAWTTDWISEEAKEKLRGYGITPPQPAGQSGLIQLEPSPSRCPRCGSLNTTTQNTFGPTLCKSIHTCNSCQEPFEAFKAI